MMPGSPVAGMVKVAALPTGTSLAGPSSVPDPTGVVVVGVVTPPGAVVVGPPPSCVADAGAGARPRTRPIAADTPPSNAAAPPTVRAVALPSTTARRSTATRWTRVTSGARSPSRTGQT